MLPNPAAALIWRIGRRDFSRPSGPHGMSRQTGNGHPLARPIRSFAVG
jgi:hypothetical protein